MTNTTPNQIAKNDYGYTMKGLDNSFFLYRGTGDKGCNTLLCHLTVAQTEDLIALLCASIR